MDETGVAEKTVLIVDDDEHFRSAIARFLQRKGWTCLTAASGSEACATARRESYDLALVDCWMPSMSGFETMHALLEARPLAPVVMISGMGTPATRTAALRQGAADFLSKHAEPSDIEAAVERSMGLGEKRREMIESGETPSSLGSRGTLLLVDDHDGFRRSVARFLRGKGFDVLEASSGVAALDVWERESVHGAIIDIHLPDASGIEVARLIRLITPKAAVAMISGEANRAEKAESLRYGITGCLDKTLGMERLEVVAQYLMDEYVRQRQVEARVFEPKPPFGARLNRWVRSQRRQFLARVRDRETRLVVAGLAVAAVLAIGLMSVKADYEMRLLDANAGDHRAPSLVEMYDKVVGYLDRDEQRELQSRR